MGKSLVLVILCALQVVSAYQWDAYFVVHQGVFHKVYWTSWEAEHAMRMVVKEREQFPWMGSSYGWEVKRIPRTEWTPEMKRLVLRQLGRAPSLLRIEYWNYPKHAEQYYWPWQVGLSRCDRDIRELLIQTENWHREQWPGLGPYRPC